MPIAIPSSSDLKNLPVTNGPIEVSPGPLPERMRLGQLYGIRKLGGYHCGQGVAAMTGQTRAFYQGLHPKYSTMSMVRSYQVKVVQANWTFYHSYRLVCSYLLG
eukprot:6213971-Pleurochrysis_carterae.AAC.3